MNERNLLLLRHGQSLSNAGKEPTADPALIPLTPEGIRQAERAAVELGITPDLILVSPLLRARQTADAFRHLGAAMEVWPVDEFVYLNFRDRPPMTPDQREPEVQNYWHRADPFLQTSPDAESFANFWYRVADFNVQVSRFPRDLTVLVVTHGYFMAAFEFGRRYGFAPPTRQLMRAVLAHQMLYPIPNCHVARYDTSDPLLDDAERRRAPAVSSGYLEVRADAQGPAGRLSNFFPHRFTFWSVPCASMEGFLQGLKCRDVEEQARICGLAGWEAKVAGGMYDVSWRTEGVVHWRGERIDRVGPAFQELIDEAFDAMAVQAPSFREALLETGDAVLIHPLGLADPRMTILTEREFCSRLMAIRARRRQTDLS